MAKNDNLKDFLTDVADAIREKKGSADLINPQNFSEEIKNLPSGGESYTYGETMECDGIGVKVVKVIKVKDGVVTLNDNAIANQSAQEIILPNTLTSIGNSCMYNCAKLSRLILPESVTSIGPYCFRACSSLASLRIPTQVQIILDGLVLGASELTALILPANRVIELRSSPALSLTPIASGTGYIYVPSNLVDAYKSATNWSVYADSIRPLSELPNE